MSSSSSLEPSERSLEALAELLTQWAEAFMRALPQVVGHL